MLFPFKWLWQQLDGPQITGIKEGLYEWIYKQLEPTLTYLNGVSLDTANSDHLNMIGALMGIPRPIITVSTEQEFIYVSLKPEGGASEGTEDFPNPAEDGKYYFPSEDTPFSKGLGDEVDTALGGKFAGLNALGTQVTELDEVTYRGLLKTIANSEAEDFNSLKMIDDIIYYLAQALKVDEWENYSIEIVTDPESTIYTNLTYGDIGCSIGSVTKWIDVLSVEAIFNSLQESIWDPTPVVFHNFADPL